MAGKRKNPAHNDLPVRVYRGKSKYEFHPPAGGSISLCPLDATVPEIWLAYHKHNEKKEDVLSVASMMDGFFASQDFSELAQDTKDDYRKYAKRLNKVFGKMSADSVLRSHIRKYLDLRGVRSKVQANREKSFLSRSYRWAIDLGMLEVNPCKGVRQFKEAIRERYVTDEEYQAVYSVAPTIVKVAMELSYLCCARQGDILSLTKAQLMEAGIFIRQGKTGKKQIKAWSDRLRSAIELASTLPLVNDVISMYVIHQRRGQRYTRDGFNSSWATAREVAAMTYPELSFNFTFHDLKAKGISDLEGSLSEKQAISGHKTPSQTARYDRKTQVVPVVGGQQRRG
ncbi:tyrosine-type recombinase/integrase [Jinshanibacter sp. LJY008]|uniref:Tyrosine-type recombinase/integrase n=1 Tax=Limnobaculum eriocheiris TaxID=2897391 RepID=A0A9X1SND5_9GAMM|nr:tyrosine-type recombinase/integrase [Limnobaculum eriocheiris]MCD1124852.1 tyrosine-type recombinase/integrase [Limnobaculum eriocheiris]